MSGKRCVLVTLAVVVLVSGIVGCVAEKSPEGEGVTKNWKITVVGVSRDNRSVRVGPSNTWRADEGWGFVIVDMVIENVGRELAAFGGPTIGGTLVDLGERIEAWVESGQGHVYTVRRGGYGGPIPSGFRVRGRMISEVPLVAKGLRLRIEFKSGGTVSLDLSREYEDPGFVFPTERTGFMQLGDSIVVPGRMSVTAYSAQKVSVKNLGGYDLKLGKYRSRLVEVDLWVFHTDGVGAKAVDSNMWGFEPRVVPPGFHWMYEFEYYGPEKHVKEYGIPGLLLEEASKLLVVVHEDTKRDRELLGYGVYELKEVEAETR